jgi:large subunit ribosomal protein L10
MARPEKVAIVDEIADKIQRTQGLYLTDYSGLDVESINELRRLLRENAVEYRVVKNTLSRLAAEKVGRDDLKPHLTGPIALAFGYDDPVLPAKLLSDFAQKTGKPQVKAILFEGQLFGQEAMDQLKTLRPRDELLALMLSTLKAPFSRTVTVLGGLLRNLVSVLDAVAKARAGTETSAEPDAEEPTEGKDEEEAKAVVEDVSAEEKDQQAGEGESETQPLPEQKESSAETEAEDKEQKEDHLEEKNQEGKSDT